MRYYKKISWRTRLVLAPTLVILGIFGGLAVSQDAAPSPQGESVPDKMTVTIDDKPILPTNGTVAGVWFFADAESDADAKKSQLLLLGHPNAGPDAAPRYRLAAELAPGEKVRLMIPNADKDIVSAFCETLIPGVSAEEKTGAVSISEFLDESVMTYLLTANGAPVYLEMTSFFGEKIDGTRVPVSLDPKRRTVGFAPIESSPNMATKLTDALIEWDWRMWDGIETPTEPRTYVEAIDKRLPQGEAMISDLIENAESDEDAARFEDFLDQWRTLAERRRQLKQNPADGSDRTAEELWRDLHQLRRKIVLANPLFNVGPILFAKHVPSVMSHQLTQACGYCARPGGGLFVLDRPGTSMNVTELTKGFPAGNFMYPAVSYDGKTILFAFCDAPESPKRWGDPDTMDRHYQIYRMNADGTDVRKLTDGPFDHFAPCLLPDGSVILSSTRRGGFHRCGKGPCRVFTLTKMDADGSNIRPISFHETHEWTPDVMNDGRIVYTRWDYVDRDAVYYQNLWSTRQDGTDVRIFYGNNTFSPCGVWEPKSVPGSNKVMAVGGPHHAMSAGSIMLIDNTLGVDGPSPVTRLTPDVLYPEAETPLPGGPAVPDMNDFDRPIGPTWNANREDRPAERITTPPEENLRWPAHSFKSPWPVSEKYFLASYSFDKLVGEIGTNIPNQFGLYFCDAFGNRELIYRDPNISSLWAAPLAPRPKEPSYVSTLPDQERDADGNLKPGRFFIQNVQESWPWKMPERIASLRIVQVLPKSTPDANNPMVGAANASPGKQILGTVPVEEDGSAQFEVPARIPFLIQALGEDGRMVEGMRSLLYAQPGETASCTGCHENRIDAVAATPTATIASRRADSEKIKPGPDGSKPLSYPILVQPVLDRLCVECHNDEKTEGNVNLTGTPDGAFSKSYNALIPYVSYTYWGAPEGNHEPMTTPNLFGTRRSRLIEILDAGHYDCSLSDEDWERLYSWIDGANALFYGTFNVEDQKRQQAGEVIDGPEIE